MDRKEFLANSVTGAVACCAFAIFNDTPPAAAAEQTDADREKDFVKNWMEDLFDTVYQELDEKTRVKLMAGCGRGCFRRFQFKQDIARLGDFLQELGPVVERVDVLPFHQLGAHKWAELDLKYTLDDVKPPSPEQVATAVRILRDRQLPAV